MQIILNRLSWGAIGGVIVFLCIFLLSKSLAKGVLEINLFGASQFILLSALIGLFIGFAAVGINIFEKNWIKFFTELIIGSLIGALFYYGWILPNLNNFGDLYFGFVIAGFFNGVLIVLLSRISV